MRGVNLIIMMQAAFDLPLSRTKVINSWMHRDCDGNHIDDRDGYLNRYLSRWMP